MAENTIKAVKYLQKRQKNGKCDKKQGDRVLVLI